MNRKIIFLALVIIALISLACTLNINVPNTQVKTGPTVTEDIHVPAPSGAETVDVTLKFGAGDFTLQPGAVGEVISGTATYNVADFKPKITTDSNNINVEQGNLKLGGIPYINQNIENKWDLFLGNQPMGLVIEAGAYTGNYELGGLSIHKLKVTDGASKVNVKFSQPNQVELTEFEYTTGASDVTLTNLGNANLTELTFHSGAGTYTLDFGGKLSRDMTVEIESGVSTVTIIVPEGTSAQVNNEGNLITVTTSGNWQQNDKVYTHSGSGYTITIRAKMGAGTLKLQTSR